KIYDTWQLIIDEFITDMQNFLEKKAAKGEKKALRNLLVYNEMVSFPKRFELIQNLSYWGYYHSALVELRFMLETLILAYYLDVQLPNTERSAKIKLMQKHKGELWGERLRTRTYLNDEPLGNEVERTLEEINDSIDEYLEESSIEIWQKDYFPYNENEYIECFYQGKNVSRLMIKHLLKSFPTFEYTGSIILNVEDPESPN
ncbi:MAG: hypothetical protein U9O98_03670, partial [Asgard group archaeon]|nr:hypothetical protein [Asgard group archaeon]